ncbi:J domain-containing protein [Microbacterium sediminis]|uniref:Molecular chaperone DnaJ n=1 Tax=Microbacterium sediminis TaxID=904291 RepID=A0A1B9NAB6_9MICO|nr:J domain-containing protein [Microbacterium sediminis]OCG73474.1 molecular chaperone DnaJ [Microbacterium sediminis]
MFDSPLSRSAYEVLGVDPAADAEAIRRAFRQQLRLTHPDTGGDAALFIEVQRAWELVGTDEARAAYDRGHGFADESDWRGWSAAQPRSGSRPRARSFGQAGSRRRARYEDGVRSWRAQADPYDPAVVRALPRELRALLARALAEEASARTIDALGMAFTVWHEVPAADDVIDHVAPGPTGLYGIASHDLGGPMRLRSDEIVGEGAETPVADLRGRIRRVARARRVRFGGAIVVLPDDDLPAAITPLTGVRELPTVVVSRSALATVLRAGVPGARPIGGNELFDVRTRLQAPIRPA